ncbi:alanine--glyoxylate aminotransferase family protein [Beijerinckia sp. L45]|uniref:pyridoxal-phosphate-dependent aminotransferase family protein n=1 Tax=Beijerinckia sp. L45 TaxID=1641855 RepID=UPI00131DD80F|nr:aminotransferase class V-fold PLP-dependent enzyme [Beijerinckia sp. L45]
MSSNMPRKAGRHFLQIPGPTPIPDRVLRAMDNQVLDHRGPTFQKLASRVLDKVKTVFKTKSHVIIFPASGTGAWEAALVNTMNPGDKLLMFETGQFATLWHNMAKRLGMVVDFIPSDWRVGVDPQKIEEKLREDKNHEIKAVCVVHHETSGGLLSDVAAIRKVIDACNHPALLFVDSVSGLGSADLRHDEWGIDVTVAGSQKGLMLPPGLAFNAISAKAIKASETAKQPKGYWAWDEMINANKSGFFPYTPATQILYGLDVAIDLLHEEGLDNVFARHNRWGVATRAAVKHWGLENLCRDERFVSPVMTAVLMPDGKGADEFRKIVLDTFDMSLGAGLNKVADKVFRIGHLGDTNDLTIMGALAGVEMGLEVAGIKHNKGGVQVAMASIAAAHQQGHHARVAAE